MIIGVILSAWLTFSRAPESLAWLPPMPPIARRSHIVSCQKPKDIDLPKDIFLSDILPSSRRLFLSSSLLVAGTLLTGGARASDVSRTTSISLPWVKDPINPKRTSLKVKDAETLGYNLEFVTYLTRFLLNFDPLAQQWWIDGGSAIPKRAAPGEIFDIRQEQFSKFAASVELGLLQEFPGPEGPTLLLQSLLRRFCSLNGDTSSASTNDAKQQRIIRETKEARRQLALLFGLLNDYQPTADITKLLASVDNGSITSMELLEPAPRGFAPEDGVPTLELAAPASVDNGSITSMELLEPAPRGFAPEDRVPLSATATEDIISSGTARHFIEVIAKPSTVSMRT